MTSSSSVLTAREAGSCSDGELLDLAFSGSPAAFGVLVARHRPVALRYARRLGCSARAEDWVSEAVVRTWEIVRSGRRVTAFRPYLLTAVRHVAYSAARRDGRVDPLAQWPDTVVTRAGLVERAADHQVLAAVDRDLAARAFTRLPARWRWVLHRTVIDGASPTVVADEAGMTPNGVSALASRARRELRAQYLVAHLDQASVASGCAAVVAQLGGRVRGQLLPQRRARLDAHLQDCAQCRARLRELTELNADLCSAP